MEELNTDDINLLMRKRDFKSEFYTKITSDCKGDGKKHVSNNGKG